jgi:fermentation-respiration switch protein FrsA (DUF1100 family)
MLPSFRGKTPLMFWSAIQIALLVYLGLAAIIFSRQSSFVFQPEMDRGYGADPSDIGLEYTALKLRTVEGETLDGWHVPAAATREKLGLVLFFHGNAGNIGHRLDYLRMFHDLGMATLIIDYRGYGRSSGTPSEEGSYLDAKAAWLHATKELGFAPDRIVIFGESLGGAVAAQLAEGHRPGALILASTFTSVPDLGAELYPWLPVRMLARIRYNTLARLPRINCPLLVVHSRSDDVIPFEHGRRLFEAAGTKKQFLEIDGGHNEGFVFARKEWIREMDGFLRRALPRTAAASPPQAPAAVAQ